MCATPPAPTPAAIRHVTYMGHMPYMAIRHDAVHMHMYDMRRRRILAPV
jgi:hypothetical protein